MNLLFDWIAANAASIITMLIVGILLILAIVKIVRDKIKGKGSCGGNCSCCAMGCACHSNKQSSGGKE